MVRLVIVLFLFGCGNSFAQSYTNYFTGNPTDTVTPPLGGSCLMGGASESDPAMVWFLNRANGGDILVLRASGADGYNDYFYTDLGVSVNSVETIVFNDASAANETYIHTKIQQAEAIWFAGGDQWDYVTYWRNTAIDSLINDAVQNRNAVIGGTSAGMAILGEFYFSAENGTVTSSTALNNPYDENVTVDSTVFLKVPFLEDVITDTHYDDPDRKGRHSVFLARILTDYATLGKGIACDEFTAVCIDPSGEAKCYGGYPTYDDNVYFIQPNCELEEPAPEFCESEIPLVWDKSGTALRVYSVKGTETGENTFNLTNWREGTGGEWQFWSITDETVSEIGGTAPDCPIDDLALIANNNVFKCYPNPTSGIIFICSPTEIQQLLIYSSDGKIITTLSLSEKTTQLDLTKYGLSGIYFIQLETEGAIHTERIIIE